jgi:glycosyltransferase involved in cell wall biosynthesis
LTEPNLPRVLFIANVFPPVIGGSAHVYSNLCQRLGSTATVLAPRKDYTDGSELSGWQVWDAEQSFHIQRLDLLRPQFRPKPCTILHAALRYLVEDRGIEKAVVDAASKLIRERRIDVVCLGELYALHKIGRTLRTRFGLPVIHYIHGEEITAPPASRRYVSGAFKSLQRASAVVAVSSFTCDQLVQLCQVSRKKIATITNGVDTVRFQPGPKSEMLLDRHRLYGKKLLLTVGRLEARKGHDMMIECLPEILRQVPETVYLVVGKGSRLESLRISAKDQGVSGRVIWATDVSADELVAYYQTADVFVMPNRTMPDGDTEGFGLVFLEAAACGKPVIAGNAGGVPDAVTDGETGLLVDGSSRSDVVNACVRLLNSAELRNRFGQAGLRRAAVSTWDLKTEEFRRICADAVGMES